MYQITTQPLFWNQNTSNPTWLGPNHRPSLNPNSHQRTDPKLRFVGWLGVPESVLAFWLSYIWPTIQSTASSTSMSGQLVQSFLKIYHFWRWPIRPIWAKPIGPNPDSPDWNASGQSLSIQIPHNPTLNLPDHPIGLCEIQTSQREASFIICKTQFNSCI